MRKICRPSSCILEAADADVPCFDAVPAEPGASGSRQILTHLSKRQMALSRPAWASFDMENSFWDRLQHICDNERLSPEEFVERAQRRYPGLFLGIAVRLEIVLYFRDRSRQIPTGRHFPVPGLHESLRDLPPPISRAETGIETAFGD